MSCLPGIQPALYIGKEHHNYSIIPVKDNKCCNCLCLRLFSIKKKKRRSNFVNHNFKTNVFYSCNCYTMTHLVTGHQWPAPKIPITTCLILLTTKYPVRKNFHQSFLASLEDPSLERQYWIKCLIQNSSIYLWSLQL